MELINDEAYMRLALQMATQALGQTAINPVVGCVIVKEGRVVGLGAHLRRGQAHAEVHALQMAGIEAEGSTVYVTLEPCSHTGQTSPCVDQLIERNVKKVVIACQDPNPLVAGNGISRLRQHGIEVAVGLLEQEAVKLNEKFIKFITTGLPFITLKSASTLDGKIAAKSGDSKWITSEASREAVHTLRHQHQAILVGIGTVLADDPQLSTRLSVPGLSPVRLIVDSKLKVPLTSKAVQSANGEQKTIILTTTRASEEKEQQLNAFGVEVLRCGDGPQVDLQLALRKLGQRQIGSILVEGGGRVNGALLQAKLVDKIIIFIAPKIIGGGEQAATNFQFPGYSWMREAIELDHLQVDQFDRDVCLTGYPRYGGE